MTVEQRQRVTAAIGLKIIDELQADAAGTVYRLASIMARLEEVCELTWNAAPGTPLGNVWDTITRGAPAEVIAQMKESHANKGVVARGGTIQ